MARSPIAPDRKTVRTSVTLPEEVLLQVQALADTNHVSSAWVIRTAVQRFLDEFQGQLELPLRRSARQGTDSNG
ncbi:CopG family transcriptional regulator [Burkholderia vietnamiensis]|uniref:ribbon-helix-helix domain-containing protein n=1 Tax=Burkholderia vietnamiensis TaxID=60552 RepID=UPI0034544A51